jgi:hypothetical protein
VPPFANTAGLHASRFVVLVSWILASYLILFLIMRRSFSALIASAAKVPGASRHATLDVVCNFERKAFDVILTQA